MASGSCFSPFINNSALGWAGGLYVSTYGDPTIPIVVSDNRVSDRTPGRASGT